MHITWYKKIILRCFVMGCIFYWTALVFADSINKSYFTYIQSLTTAYYAQLPLSSVIHLTFHCDLYTANITCILRKYALGDKEFLVYYNIITSPMNWPASTSNESCPIAFDLHDILGLCGQSSEQSIKLVRPNHRLLNWPIRKREINFVSLSVICQ